jgi:hypothetical protein
VQVAQVQYRPQVKRMANRQLRFKQTSLILSPWIYSCVKKWKYITNLTNFARVRVGQAQYRPQVKSTTSAQPNFERYPCNQLELVKKWIYKTNFTILRRVIISTIPTEALEMHMNSADSLAFQLKFFSEFLLFMHIKTFKTTHSLLLSTCSLVHFKKTLLNFSSRTRYLSLWYNENWNS